VTTLMALDALARDPATRTLVVISKPPAPPVAERVLARVATIDKPVVLCFLGLGELDLPPRARLAPTLRAAAELAAGRLAGSPAPTPPRPRPGARWVRGLYCGGTLCAEAQVVFGARGLAVRSNVPVPGARQASAGDPGHTLLDLGADEYARGRPHPMLEPEIRNDHVRAALADRDVAVVLADVVLGWGAHADPAGVLASAVRETPGGAPVIASVTGTEQDPQGYSRQTPALRDAGVVVAPSAAHAAELGAAVVGREA
jgi:FdrA protein